LEGRNVHIEARFAAGSTDQFEQLAKELVAPQPDVIGLGRSGETARVCNWHDSDEPITAG